MRLTGELTFQTTNSGAFLSKDSVESVIEITEKVYYEQSSESNHGKRSSCTAFRSEGLFRYANMRAQAIYMNVVS